ncbi:GLPGLI family protein [Pedobacter sp. PWIIR3]
MNKNIVLTGFLIITSCYSALSQNVRFPFEGTIEFEKTVNMHALLKKSLELSQDGFMREYYDAQKKNSPQFKVLNSTLNFTKDKTLFTPAIQPESRGFNDNPMVQQNSIIHTDLANGTYSAQKKVYEETFLVKDSVRKINWKLTSEVRTIAGYECRRANAIIMDSIYVVAFYTDKIPVSGGPESFTGLPGMILGVALPHENITWFAKTVTDKAMPAEAVKPPTKGKATDNKGLIETINRALKDWGVYGKSAVKAFTL